MSGRDRVWSSFNGGACFAGSSGHSLTHSSEVRASVERPV
jgi:hypothetical protein